MSNPKDPFVEFQAGATVFKEGDGGNEMYVIESGQVDILHPSGNGEVAASFGPGDFFGEAAMLEDLPRHATALAKAATRLLRIERAAFAEVLRHNPEIAIRIMRTMMARQRVTEQSGERRGDQPHDERDGREDDGTGLHGGRPLSG